MEILENKNLAEHTTLGVGGPAKYFVNASNIKEIKNALDFAKDKDLPVLTLGGGSNILASDKGFKGLVIKINLLGIEKLKTNTNEVLLGVGAGENWDEFVLYTVNQGLGGIECLSGIPGLVGASPVQNIGAYGQEVKDVVKKVEVLDLESGTIKDFSKERCEFSYRNSIFKKEGGYVITRVIFSFKKDYSSKLKYEALAQAIGRKEHDLKKIRSAVLAFRKQKSMIYSKDDTNSHSTGSFFVNPLVSAKKLEALLKKYPKLPHWEVQQDKDRGYKLAAAWLIEQAGFYKGYKYKTAALSEKHTLAMVNRGKATASDIYEFSKLIRKKVLDVFEVGLELEAVLVGDFN